LEANTSILLTQEGIQYTSPIRQHQLAWSDIEQLNAYKAGNGWRIIVQTKKISFRFQTATTLRGMGGVEARTGFPQGEEIVGQILRNVNFHPPEYTGRSWVWRAK
jgi:hypothetical protein